MYVPAEKIMNAFQQIFSAGGKIKFKVSLKLFSKLVL